MNGYERIGWTRLIVSAVLLLAGLGMVAHWFLHPDHPHPPEMAVTLCILLGAAGLLPVEVNATLGHAKDWLPWAGQADRREVCGTCGHPVHPAAPCAVPTVAGECGCTGQ